METKPATAVAAAVLCLLLASAAAPAQASLVVGVDADSGVEQQIAHVLCRVIDSATGSACAPVATPGAGFNLANVAGGALDLALVPADSHHHAVDGTGPFAFTGIPYDKLRSLFSLHVQALTVVARRDADILELSDLAGRRVNLGSPGTRGHETMGLVMAAMGWSEREFQLAGRLPAAEQSLALCHGRFEAVTFAVAHPDEDVARSIELCDARIVHVRGAAIERLLREHPYYVRAVVPGDLYVGQPEAAEMFGVRATVVASAGLDPGLVEDVVAALFEHLERLREAHPVLADLTPGAMIREGLAAPLHEGAARYYRTRGWIAP